MTREEAVKRIKEIQKLYVFTPTINEALDLAIEALQGDTEGDAESATTTDCISRQAAIEQIDKWHDFYADSSLRTDKARRDELSAIKAMLINLPSLPPVNQKQFTGKLESVENATSEGEESTTGQPKSKLESADDTFCKSQLITCNRVKECNGVCPFEDALKHADQMAIEALSEERTGEWKEVMIRTDSGIAPVKDWWYCSLCNNHVSYKYNYCPNCGAKMGGDTE